MAEIDPVIHQPVRLRVVAALAALDVGEQVEFTYLRDHLGLTDGNLGAHLLKLEEAKYIRIVKTFVGRKPKTYVEATGKGRDAFTEHVAALRAIIGTEERKGKKNAKRKP